MKKAALLTSCLFLLTFLQAAPAKGPVYETTAEGYPAWAGFTEANYITGRHLCPSDMRHKVAIVVLVDSAKFEEQLKATAFVGGGPSFVAFHDTAETAVLPRNVIRLYVLTGRRVNSEEVVAFMKKAGKDFPYTANIYQNVTCSKMPDNGGKLPFLFAFGPEPGEAVESGPCDAEMTKKIGALCRDKKYRLEGWRPYYGTVEEPKFVKSFAKQVASGKPLDGLTAVCRKGISSKTPEQAVECQILFDALEQTRSDLMFSIETFAPASPTRALYEAQTLTKQWPKSKKILKEKIDKLMAIPEMGTLFKMFVQLKTWGAEDFMCKNAGEAKKIEAELKKIKTACDGYVEKSSNAQVQSMAAWMAGEADNLAPLMSSRIKTK